MNSKRRAATCILAVTLVVAIEGCAQVQAEGVTRTISCQWWVPWSMLVGGVIAAVAGWFLREFKERYGWGLLILGLLAVIVGAPTYFRERVVVDDSKFSMRSGIWGLSMHEVAYAGLERVRSGSERSGGSRTRQTNYYLLCERKDGTSTKIPVDSALARAAVPHFLQRVQTLGVVIVVPGNWP